MRQIIASRNKRQLMLQIPHWRPAHFRNELDFPLFFQAAGSNGGLNFMPESCI